MLKLLVLGRINECTVNANYFALKVSISINITLTKFGSNRILVSAIGSFYMYIQPCKLQAKPVKSIFLK